MEQLRAEVVEGKDGPTQSVSVSAVASRAVHTFTALHLGWQEICAGCMGDSLGRLGLAVLARSPLSLLPCGLFESVTRLSQQRT